MRWCGLGSGAGSAGAGGGTDGASPSCRTTCSELCRREQSRRRWACSRAAGLYDWPFQVEALLFKRSRRPDSLPLTLALLERLQAAPGLRPHQRVYAGIALAYAALQADDTRRLQELRPWLESVASLGRG